MKLLSVLIVLLFTISCTRNNVKERPQYKAIFDKYKVYGTFATYDNVYDENSIYNLVRFRDSSFSPANTFHILTSLVGLEIGAIVKNEKIKFNGLQLTNTKEADLNLNEAMQSNSEWYFKNALHTIGKDTLQNFMDSISYGTKIIKTNLDSFFMNNTLQIKPDEQLGLLKKIYFKNLSKLFSNRTYDAVKEALRKESTDKYGMYYTTGTTLNINKQTLTWIMGWIETTGTKPKVNFFLLNMEGNMKIEEIENIRKPMLLELLKEEKIL